IHLLSDSYAVIRQHAAGTLWNLAYNNEINQNAIREANGITPLVLLLSDKDSEIRRKATGALWNLADNDRNRHAIHEANGIVPLVRLLSDSDSAIYAAGTLENLAFNNELNQNAIREANGIVLLVSLLSNSYIDTKKQATRTLLSLSYNETNKNSIREANGIEPLICLLSNSDSAIRQDVASTLKNLALNNELNQHTIREKNGISLLVSLLSDSDSVVHPEAAEALWNLALNNQSNKNAIREADGIKSLISLLPNSDLNTKKQATGALLSLSYNELNQNAIREANGIAPLVRLLSDSDSVIRQHAAETLENLACNNEINQNAIREANGIEPLICLLSNSDSVIRQHAAETLKNLACNNEINQNAIREANGITPLVRLLSDKDSEIRQRATGALQCLSINTINKNSIYTAKGITPLVRLLLDNDSITRYCATITLWNLMFDINIDRNAIRNTGGISHLIDLLSDSEPKIRKHAAGILKILSHNNSDNKTAILEGNSLSVLEYLSQFDEDLETQEYAQAILNNCREKSNTRQHEEKEERLEESQKNIFDQTKKRLKTLTAQYQDNILRGLDVKLNDYSKSQQDILKNLVQQMLQTHSNVHHHNLNENALRNDILKTMQMLADLKYQLTEQNHKMMNNEQIINKLDLAFGDEATDKIAFKNFKKQLQDNNAQMAFFIEFVTRFSAKLDAARLLQSGYLDLSASTTEQVIDFSSQVIACLPLPFIGVAPLVAQGINTKLNSDRQTEVARTINHLEIISVDITKFSQKLGCDIVKYYAEAIDAVFQNVHVSS
ncbi:MAG TPA: HEAT repeat domain-containing protein, partial [Legionellaceae bacterium]|nr:HEAT repeat domain-containing protein [Legionellaceae bacterium]